MFHTTHFIFYTLLLFFPFLLNAQYIPYNTLPENQEELKEDYIERLKKDLELLEKTSYKEELKDFYKARTQRIIDKIKNEHLIFDPKINDYFNSILSHLIEKNPKFEHKELKLFVTRYAWPNASCLGEGTLLLNLGLIRHLENESQVAFVIAHEMAHYYLDHVNQGVRDYYEELYSKETQKELKKISKSEFNQFERTAQLMKKMVYDDRKHSREHEAEADALGYEIIKNSKYDPSEIISLLSILDEIDGEKYSMPLPVGNIFNAENYPFRKRWLMEEQTMMGGVSKEEEGDWNSDSLRTHPDCQKRIELLSDKIKPNESKIKDEKFLSFAEAADKEIILFEREFRMYGKALFHTLQLLQNNPDNVFLHTIVGQCFNALYMSQKNHELSKFVEKPSKRHDGEYNKILLMVQNLRLREMALVGYHYLKEKEQFHKNENFLYQLILLSKKAKQEDLDILKKNYKKLFPEGKYKEQINKV